MFKLIKNLAFFCIIICAVYCSKNDKANFKWPTVGISVLVRNKAATLPYFFTCLLNLDYPKDRLYVWIYSDLNEDNSIDLIKEWVKMYGSQYNGVHVTTNASKGQTELMAQLSDWSTEHFRHIIKLREEALQFSRKMWADFLFMLDADVFLTDPATLKILVNKGETIVAPMLISDGLYSNFWCGMTETYYYKRTDEYRPIRERKNVGCYEVLMVHSAVLISMKEVRSDVLTYDPKKVKSYDGPEDDIIAFAINAKLHNIPLKVCNDHIYGFVPVPSDLTALPEQMVNIKIEALSHGIPIPLNEHYQKYVTYPKPWKFGCDEIYVINLMRRDERRRLMELSLKEIGMEAQMFKAVDGRGLNVADLTEFNIQLMPGYEDPYHKRPMKAGEIGCFLSHYLIWEEIVEKHQHISLVLEDDVHFVPYFRHKLYQLMEEIKDLNWDLVYIGRKILENDAEVFVTEHTTKPLYSYWTLGYLISEKGAKKLLDADPLRKLLPVDEFLPIMFDQHPNDSWKAHFPVRNLNAFSAAPLLVHPTHYTGQKGYISDTEESPVWQTKSKGVKTEL